MMIGEKREDVKSFCTVGLIDNLYDEDGGCQTSYYWLLVQEMLVRRLKMIVVAMMIR